MQRKAVLVVRVSLSEVLRQSALTEVWSSLPLIAHEIQLAHVLLLLLVLLISELTWAHRGWSTFEIGDAVNLSKLVLGVNGSSLGCGCIVAIWIAQISLMGIRCNQGITSIWSISCISSKSSGTCTLGLTLILPLHMKLQVICVHWRDVGILPTCQHFLMMWIGTLIHWMLIVQIKLSHRHNELVKRFGCLKNLWACCFQCWLAL